MLRDADAHDDRLLELARRLLEGEVIDWAKEDVAESEVREGMRQLERIIGRPGERTQTRHASDSESPVPPPSASPIPTGEDRVIGGFRLVHKLGEGGMGVVYEAEQQHPRRAVALKVIRGGALVSPDTLKLFRREIQTLARLNHSGIAQLYETGVTDDGMHFFAMELVRGVTLSDWLRSRPKGPITPAEIKLRLGVFRKICDAVAYAHQKGVIHRDLKPGNILIPKPVEGASIQDAVPEVKVLDFGLARITDSDVQATTFVTEMGKVQGTLPYMSPEQVRGNPDEIDLRTDVYALGVILYEMIAGRLPYDLSKAHIHEAVRIICEAPPRSLTTTFSGTRRLDADVATIATKCLEKEASRRYQSAAALGEEIHRYLAHQPILARPPSALYQFRKLVARHKTAFGTMAAVFVLLLGTTVTMTVQARRIALERDRANREAAMQKMVSEFLDSLLRSRGLYQASQPATTEEVLAAGAARIDRELAGAPLLQAQFMNTIANVYLGLGYRDQAKALLEKAIAIRRRHLGEDSPLLAHSLMDLGDVYAGTRRIAEGKRLVQRALEIQEKQFGPDHPEVASVLERLNGYLAVAGDNAGAQEMLERAIKILEKDATANSRLLSWCVTALGIRKFEMNDYAGALEQSKRALAIKEKFLDPDELDVSQSMNNVGFILMKMRRFDEAQPILERAVDIAQRAGPRLPVTGANLGSLGELWWRRGEPSKAKPYLVQSVNILRPLDAGYLGASLHLLACVLSDLKENVAAEEMFESTLAWQAEHLDPAASDAAAPEVAETLTEYARLKRATGRMSEAAAMERRAAAVRQKSIPAGASP